MSKDQALKQEDQDKSELARKEEKILEFWKESRIFEKTLQKESPKGEFVFYEGPPTANGRPGLHHLESRAFKDAIPRYRTMAGYHVRRKAGWDTHGLPVELEVEKELGISSKPQIEEFGIAEFNKRCKQSVWKYMDEWQKFTERIGYWVDLADAYVTYSPSYIESLWWVLKEVDNKDLLYKDYKVVPWCSRCGTALSSHELAQGYADVKDLSVTVKFELIGEPHTYILAWTTTPWTLPGNVGLAVGEEISYVKVISEDSTYILAKERLPFVFRDTPYTISEEFLGKDLIGKTYKPLYPYLSSLITRGEQEKLENAYKVYGADFVTTEDGTGVVHTAVMYGQEDFDLGTKVGLPKVHLVDESGHFVEGTDFLARAFVKDPDTDVAIIKNLAGRNLLFSKEKYEHSYPHCWRCKTPLIYYARDSWYIRISTLRNTLVKENADIHWEPAHIKEGRFGEWLSGIRDWAISRERYWGTPLPVWQSDDGEKRVVIGSIEELKKKTKSTNAYFIMRHAESDHNVTHTLNGDPSKELHLTESGRTQAQEIAQTLKDKNIDLIITSPFIRTKETAQIVAEILGVSEIIEDERIREVKMGVFEGKTREEYHAYFSNSLEDTFTKHVEDGETSQDVKNRMGEFIYDIDALYQNKNILIISHGGPLWLLKAAVEGLIPQEASKLRNGTDEYISYGEVKELPFAPIPHNENYELDLHRPYIDDVVWKEDGQEMRRVKEVMDVWFDSGAMPFAQDHYPFENKERVEKNGFPADYISEAIDQTRGWFYTLHAVGVLLGRGKAYKNVICLGHILDAQGQKMSKSKGNTVNPWEMADKYGIDVLRFWMYSINQPGESKNFDEKTVDEVTKKVFNLLLNSLNFYEMYAEKDMFKDPRTSPHVLDLWVIARLDALTKEVTEGLEAYRLLEPARAIRDFVADLSQWYIRRSRDRFKGSDTEDRSYVASTTRYVFKRIAILLAPFTPFLAEDIYQRVKDNHDKESVHLESWPEMQDADPALLDLMNRTRHIVSLGLDARDKAGIKIRQPLSKIRISSDIFMVPANQIGESLKQVIADELNVKEVLFEANLSEDVILDPTITEELKREGQARELIRLIQDMRKKASLQPSDRIVLYIDGTEEVKVFVEAFKEDIKTVAGIQEVIYEKLNEMTTSSIEDLDLALGIEKV